MSSVGVALSSETVLGLHAGVAMGALVDMSSRMNADWSELLPYGVRALCVHRSNVQIAKLHMRSCSERAHDRACVMKAPRGATRGG